MVAGLKVKVEAYKDFPGVFVARVAMENKLLHSNQVGWWLLFGWFVCRLCFLMDFLIGN